MQACRLIKARYAADPLDPQGAKLYGGRWNSRGMPAVYVAGSIALAALEKLVHLHRADALNHCVLCTITLDDAAIMTLAEGVLPTDWRNDPPPSSTAAIGDEWLSRGESLALAIPSTIVPQEDNLLLNPRHQGFADLARSTRVEPFTFDARLA